MSDEVNDAVDFLRSQLPADTNSQTNYSVIAGGDGNLKIIITGLELDDRLKQHLIISESLKTSRSRAAVTREIGKGLIDSKSTFLAPEQQLKPKSSGAVNRALNVVDIVIDRNKGKLAQGFSAQKIGAVTLQVLNAPEGHERATAVIEVDAGYLLGKEAIEAKQAIEFGRREAMGAPVLDGKMVRGAIREALATTLARDSMTDAGRQEFLVSVSDSDETVVKERLEGRFFPHGAQGKISVRKDSNTDYTIRFNAVPEGYEETTSRASAQVKS